MKFVRQSVACEEKETTNLEVIRETPLLEIFNQLLKYLLSDQTGTSLHDKRITTLINEILGVLINFSADDDSQIISDLMMYDYVACLDVVLRTYSNIQCKETFNDTLINNTLWILGNIIGDSNPEYIINIMENTCLIEFLGSLITMHQSIQGVSA